ncbi:MAG: hypothetical protein RR420_01330 [Anaerovoracaceae bacterium]
MSMEKYAVDLECIPPTDDQILRLRELGYDAPQTSKQAEELIESLSK